MIDQLSTTKIDHISAALQLPPLSIDAARLIFDLYTTGHSTGNIARRLDELGVPPAPPRRRWSSATVAAVLRHPGHCASAVSRDVWTRAQRLPCPPAADRFPLAGLVACACCGSPADGASVAAGAHRYYLCRARRRHAAACNGPRLRADTLEAAIWTRLLQLPAFSHPDDVTDARARDAFRLRDALAPQPTPGERAETYRRFIAAVMVDADGVRPRVRVSWLPFHG